MNDKVDKGTPQFDWVTERAACSLPKVFKDLGSQLEADVKTRNALRPNNSPYEFAVKEDVSDITVLLQSADQHRHQQLNRLVDVGLVDTTSDRLFEG